MNEIGAETVYVTSLNRPAVNIGVSILAQDSGAAIDPWYLGAQDENTVQGFAGTPIDVNALTFDYRAPVGAASAAFPRQGQFYVAVDSPAQTFSGRSLAGRYVLRSWVNDVSPPSLQFLTTRVSAGRPTLVFRTLDSQSGVDPYSLTIGYAGILVAAAAYDPVSGLAVFPLPVQVPALKLGTVRMQMLSSDYEEAKNIETVGPSIMPNTRFDLVKMHVVAGVAVDWLAPATRVCLAPKERFVVAASAPRHVGTVRFAIDGKRVAVVRKGEQGLWGATVSTRGLAVGRHTATAVATAGKGRAGSERRTFFVCHG